MMRRILWLATCLLVAVSAQDSTPVQGEVWIELKYVPTEMGESLVSVYDGACTDYFAESLASINPPITNVQAEMLEQEELVSASSRLLLLRRSLQSEDLSLLTRVKVTGEVEGASSIGGEMNLVLFYSVLNDRMGLVASLKALTGASSAFFSRVEDVDAYDVDKPKPTSSKPTDGGADPNADADDDDDPVLSQTAIIGIAVAGAIWCALVGGAIVYTLKNPSNQDSNRGAAARPAPQTPPRRPEQQKVKKQPQPAALTAHVEPASNIVTPPDEHSTSSSLPPPSRSYEPVSVAASSNVSYDGGASQQQSVAVTEDYSKQTGTAGDNMSYTYSLDAGNVDNPSLTDTSGIPLTTGGESTLDDQTTEFSARPNMVSRQVLAPPGKLGIVIDTTLEGPVVHRVNDGSPLQNLVYPGDIIVAIDDVDTRAMSASAITALMVKTANLERHLTVLSEENAGGSTTDGGTVE